MARLSWPGWLVIYRDRFFPHRSWTLDTVTHPSCLLHGIESHCCQTQDWFLFSTSLRPRSYCQWLCQPALNKPSQRYSNTLPNLLSDWVLANTEVALLCKRVRSPERSQPRHWTNVSSVHHRQNPTLNAYIAVQRHHTSKLLVSNCNYIKVHLKASWTGLICHRN